jgi:tripartite-type tricarboxylate transporter receptor subunit TctC
MPMRIPMLALALVLITNVQAVAGDKVADFFRGKQVKLLVGSAAGSGYDITARAVASHLGAHIPGHPSILVENVPGAASLVMTNDLANSEPRDGTVLGAALNGMPTAPLLQPNGVRFDPAALTWIGSENRDVQVLYVWRTAPIKQLSDLETHQLIVGAESPGTSQYDFPMVTRKLLGLMFKVVAGYTGTAQVNKAMEAGEVQGVAALAWSSLNAISANWLKDGQIRVIAQWNWPPSARLPPYPSVYSLAKTKEQQSAMRLLTSRLDIGRPFLAPPGVPADRSSALRQAFDETMKDPAFLADAAKLNLDVNPMTGRDVEALVVDISKTPESVVRDVRSALKN